MNGHHENALIIFSRTPKIDRSDAADPFATYAWEDLDALYTAFVGDVVKNVLHLQDTDVLLYRNPKEMSDDLFIAYRQRVHLFDLKEAPLIAEQIQLAIEQAFQGDYRRIVLLLDNNPLISKRFLKHIFDQLRYDDDCIILGPTIEGKIFLVGMRSDHSDIFSIRDGNPLENPSLLIKRICALPSILFPLDSRFCLDSASNLSRLRMTIETLDKSSLDYPAKTYDMLKLFDKKYRIKKFSR